MTHARLPMGAKSGIRAISHAAAVLRALQPEPQGLSLSEMAGRVNLSRRAAWRIVEALASEKLLVMLAPELRITLGPAIGRLAAAANVDARSLVRPFLHRLSDATHESVDLCSLTQQGAVLIDQVRTQPRWADVSVIGEGFPLHCTANGKALLASVPAARRDEYLASRLKRFTPNTVTDPTALEREIRAIGESGLAIEVEEHSVGICAVGVSFKDLFGRTYSLSIAVPTRRFAGKRRFISLQLLRTRQELLGRKFQL
jgi:IclR family transcriptional regulator, acetate operon repressor